MVTMSKLDAVYRSILLTKFFTKGWGKPENLKRLFEFRKIISNREECFKLVDPNYPITITKDQKLSDCHIIEGYFLSPLEKCLPGIVPEIARKAHFQVLLPLKWADPGVKPVCLHLAGTGDHFFWRRRNLIVKPLLKEASIGGIILENPFYGLRKPMDQVRSSLHNVSDIFVMGGCLILEALVLFHWCERNGLGPLGVTGLSMGGHMASLAATNWPKPLVLVPCLSWSTASAVFLQGVMSQSINWDLLEDQYLSDGEYREKLSKMVTIIDEPFLAGKKFAQTFAQDIKNEKVNFVSHEIRKNNFNLELSHKVIDTASSASLNIVDSVESKNTRLKSLQPDGTIENLDRSPSNNVHSTFNIQKSYKQTLTNKNEIDNFNAELTKLFEEGKLDCTLFEKLTSNEKFQLDAKEIEDLNKFTEERVKDILLKFKMDDSPTQIKEKIATEIIEDIDNDPKTISDHIAIDNDPKTISDHMAIDKPKRSAYWKVSELTHDWWTHFPFKRTSVKKIDISKIHWRDREALQFMRGIMDECTHLSNFSVPYDTSLIIAVCAKHDAYVPRADVGRLEDIWPGAEVRYVEAGHVSAYILHQSVFRSCIIEAFERSKKKWKNGQHVNT